MPLRLAAALILVLAACNNAAPEQAAPGDTPAAAGEIREEVIATGLNAPWDVAFTPGGETYVTERDSGRVLELAEDGSTREVHSFEVDSSSEAGLLGLVAHPNDDGVLYAYFTGPEDNRVVRFRPGGEVEPIVAGIPKAGIHNGGRVAFGPDGMLYISTGDAGQRQASQDRGSPAGKILRVNPDGSVPDDNPVSGSAVWSLGHRNVQGLAWDADDRLYATEFGPDADDEINLIEPGGNYGWPEVTGEAGREEFVDPLVVRQPTEASWSGAVIPLDSAVPDWDGSLLAAGLRGERLWRFTLDDGVVTGAEELYVERFGRLRTIVHAPDGSLWLLTNNRDGRGSPGPDDDRIVRIVQ